jgi:heme A synthase
MELFLKITFAILLLMVAWRLWPAAKDQMENGPKGSSSEWRGFAIILLAVVLFVALLIAMVRG